MAQEFRTRQVRVLPNRQERPIRPHRTYITHFIFSLPLSLLYNSLYEMQTRRVR